MAALLRRCFSNVAKVLFVARNTAKGRKVPRCKANADPLNIKALVSSHIVQERSYASNSGEYDKLWAAATGGRGAGRGKKKKVVRGVDPELLGFDKAGLKFEGFNAPVSSAPSREGLYKDKGTQSSVSQMFGKQWAERGWCGTTWPGRKIGHPQSPNGVELTNFDSVVLELRRVMNMTSGGRKKTQRAIVAVGNRNGVAGFGVGKGQTPLSAMKQARNKAVNYLYYVERCDDHTIYHDLKTKHKKTTIHFFRKPPGFGLRCHRLIKDVAMLLGIKDMRCKVKGPTTTLSLVRATFQGLISQETHQELANRTCLNVVEFRPECENRPVIVASPSEEALRRWARRKVKSLDSDLKEMFDPYRGLHRPKRRQDLY